MVKTCELRQYSNWSVVIETLDILTELYGKSEIASLIKTAKFRAGLFDILLVLQHLNFDDPCTVLVANYSISFFLDAYKTSKNPHNQEIASKTAKAFTNLMSAPEGVYEFQKTIPQQLETLQKPLLMLLVAIKNLIVESYLANNSSAREWIHNGKEPTEEVLRVHIQKLESLKFGQRFTALKSAILCDSC